MRTGTHLFIAPSHYPTNYHSAQWGIGVRRGKLTGSSIVEWGMRKFTTPSTVMVLFCIFFNVYLLPSLFAGLFWYVVHTIYKMRVIQQKRNKEFKSLLSIS